MKTLLRATALSLVFLLAACHSNRLPEGVLDEDAMVGLLSDIYLVEGYYAVQTHYRYDSLSSEVLSAYDNLLAKHHVGKDQVEASLDYYAQHPDRYQRVHERVQALIESDTLSASDR